jgi:transcription antitermination factor NusG
MGWNVLYLHPRSEKKVADVCRLSHIAHYLPLRRTTRVYQRRRVTFETPLFPGYLFVEVGSRERLVLQKTNHVVRFLVPRSSFGLLRQLVQVRRALRADPGLRTVIPLVQGQRVRIVAGPFQGIEGVVARLKRSVGPVRVVLNVDLLGKAVVVEAGAEQVARI